LIHDVDDFAAALKQSGSYAIDVSALNYDWKG
jgi:hypothetical protein